MNVLVLCYVISPTKGSEYSVAWNYVSNMSKKHNLSVLFGASGNHMGDCEEMEQVINNGGIPNVSFYKVKADRLCRLLNYLNVNGIAPYSFYFAFRRWQRLAYKQAKNLCKNEKFDLIHFLGPIGYREPGYLWKIKLPYLWGPIGGLNIYPTKMFGFLEISDRMKYGLRNMANLIQMNFSLRVRFAMKRADKVIVASTEMLSTARAVYDREFDYLPENGIISYPINTKPLLSRFGNHKQNVIKMISIGRLDGGKNHILILEALHKSKNLKHFHLDIVGDGPLKKKLMNYTLNHELDGNVSFHGQVPREKVMELLSNSHLNIITSIGEANTTVMFEAMVNGVPTISVDHCGMHDTINDDSGYKIKVDAPKKMIDELAGILDRIADNPEELKSKSENTLENSRKYSWDSRIAFFENCYAECIENYRLKKNN